MSYQIGLNCYPDALAAAQAAASSSAGSFILNGGNTYAVSFATASVDSISYTLTPTAGGSAVTLVVPFVPVPCNLLDASDAMALGWGMIAVWVGVYGVMFLARAFRGETGGEYGNS